MERIEQEICGHRLGVGQRTLQPVARLSGLYWQSPDGQSAGGLVHLSPTEVIVEDERGEYRVPLPIPTKDVLFAQLRGAIAIAMSALAAIALMQVWARRQQ